MMHSYLDGKSPEHSNLRRINSKPKTPSLLSSTTHLLINSHK